MSLEDQYHGIVNFHTRVCRFNETVQLVCLDLQKMHDVLETVWQEETRHQYETLYQSMLEGLQQYARLQGPIFADALKNQASLLEGYLTW
jgi:hypothetical protein